jgi:hypothetical protein
LEKVRTELDQEKKKMLTLNAIQILQSTRYLSKERRSLRKETFSSLPAHVLSRFFLVFFSLVKRGKGKEMTEWMAQCSKQRRNKMKADESLWSVAFVHKLKACKNLV